MDLIPDGLPKKREFLVVYQYLALTLYHHFDKLSEDEKEYDAISFNEIVAKCSQCCPEIRSIESAKFSTYIPPLISKLFDVKRVRNWKKYPLKHSTGIKPRLDPFIQSFCHHLLKRTWKQTTLFEVGLPPPRRRRKKHQKVGLAHDRGELSPEPMMITKEEEKPLFFSPFFEFIDDHHHDLCPGISDTATVVQNAQRIADSDGVVKRKYIAEKSKSGSRVIGVLQAGKLFFSFCERVRQEGSSSAAGRFCPSCHQAIQYLKKWNANQEYLMKNQEQPPASCHPLSLLVHQVIEQYGDEWVNSFNGKFIQTQLEVLLNNTPNGNRWDQEILNFFATLQFYGGKRVINLLRGKGCEGKKGDFHYDLKTTNLCIPADSTLRRLIPPVEPYQWFDDKGAQVTQRIQILVQMLKKQRIDGHDLQGGGLICDEMEIRSGLVYLRTSGRFVGLVDKYLKDCELDPNLLVDYTPELAKKVCQIFFISNCGTIAFPVTFIPTISLTGTQLFEVFTKISNEMKEKEIVVMWTSSDGFSGSLDYSTKMKDVLHFFDYVHLVKNGRNNLLNRLIQIDGVKFSMKTLSNWWSNSVELQLALKLDDICPSDKQNLVPVMNLLRAATKIKEFGQNTANEREKKKVFALVKYLEMLLCLHDLFSNNSWDIDCKIETATGLIKRLETYQAQSKRQFTTTEFFNQTLQTLNNLVTFLKKEDVYFMTHRRTSMLGTNLCENHFSVIRSKIRYPSLYEYAFLESHGWIELIKKFSPNRLYAMPKRTLGKKSALKYNDQTGVIFDFSELSSLISYTKEKRKKSSSSLFPSATPEQVALAKMIADAYRCTRKRLTTRQMTCLVVGGDESHRIVQTLQTSDSFPSQLYPCPWEDCPKQYRFLGYLNNHLVKRHSGEHPFPTETSKNSNVTLTPPNEPDFSSLEGQVVEIEDRSCESVVEIEDASCESVEEFCKSVVGKKDDNCFGGFVVWDGETTGKTKGSNKQSFVSLALVAWKFGESSKKKLEFHEAINPGEEIPITSQAYNIHGLSHQFLRKRDTFDQVFPRFFRFLNLLRTKEKPLVMMIAHNGKGCDEPTLKNDCQRYGIQVPSFVRFFDSKELYFEIGRDKGSLDRYPKWSVDHICTTFSIDRSLRGKCHDALLDARVQLKIVEFLYEKYKTENAKLKIHLVQNAPNEEYRQATSSDARKPDERILKRVLPELSLSQFLVDFYVEKKIVRREGKGKKRENKVKKEEKEKEKEREKGKEEEGKRKRKREESKTTWESEREEEKERERERERKEREREREGEREKKKREKIKREKEKKVREKKERQREGEKRNFTTGLRKYSEQLNFKKSYSFLPETEKFLSSDPQKRILLYPNLDRSSVEIFPKDLNSLVSNAYLNDSLIDFYLKYLMKNKQTTAFSFLCLSTFFLTKLENLEHDYSILSCWFLDYDKIDYLFLPFNIKDSHWSLFVLSIPEQKMWHLDSMRGFLSHRVDTVIEKIKKLFQSNFLPKGLGRLERLEVVKPIVPQQENDVDCGVFVMKYVEEFLLHLSQEEKPDSFLTQSWFTKNKERSEVSNLIVSLAAEKNQSQ